MGSLNYKYYSPILPRPPKSPQELKKCLKHFEKVLAQLEQEEEEQKRKSFWRKLWLN